MAKITALPAAVALTGDEYLPLVQGADTKRTTLRAFREMIVPFLQNWYKGDRGTPGGDASSVGLFAELATMIIPIGVDRITTTGHTRVGIGAAVYIASSKPDAYIAARPKWMVKTANGRAFRLFSPEGRVSPDQTGALGTRASEEASGIPSDDHDAFEACAAYITEGYANTLFFPRPAARYNLGKQTPHPAGPANGYLVGRTAMAISCERLTVEWAGTFRHKSGMKLGSFDPDTGNPITPAPGGFYNYSKRADIGTMFFFDVRYLVERGSASFDGNSLNMEIGGYWGDTAYQLDHTYKRYNAYRHMDCSVAINVQDFLLDGIIVQWPSVNGVGLNETSGVKPSNLFGHTIMRCGRNNYSIVGAIDLLIDYTEASNPGMGYHATGMITSAPAANVDWEAENGGIVARCGTGPNTVLKQGPFGVVAWVADSGPSRDCYAHGTQIYGDIWTSKPGSRFIDIVHHGIIRKAVGGSTDPKDNTLFRGLTASDETKWGQDPKAKGNYYFDAVGSGPGVRFEAISRITTAFTRLRLEGVDCSGGQIIWTVRNNTNTIDSGDFITTVSGGDLNLKLIDQVPRGAGTGSPATPYYVADNGLRGRIEIVPPAGDIEFKLRFGLGTASRPSPAFPSERVFTGGGAAADITYFGVADFNQDGASTIFAMIDVGLALAELPRTSLELSLRMDAGGYPPAYGLTWHRQDDASLRVNLNASTAITATDLKLHWQLIKRA